MMQPSAPKTNATDQTCNLFPLVLGSASPRRQELLRLLEIPFTISASTVDESRLSAPTPLEFVRLAAAEKCSDVAQNYTEPTIVIGSDTMVCCSSQDQHQGRIFGKPKNKNEAQSTLQYLSGRTHEVITAIALIQTASDQPMQIQSEITQVTFRDLSDAEIQAYIETDEPHDKAGAYALQGEGAQFIESINGDLPNVMGLPLQLLRTMLLPYYPQINIPTVEAVAKCLGVRASKFL